MSEQEELTEETVEVVRLHPAGGVYDSLVVEPNGNHYYIWQQEGRRGYDRAEKIEEADEWVIRINGKLYAFDGKPLDRILWFQIPEEFINDWVEGLYNSKDGLTIYQQLKKALNILEDLPLEYYYDIKVLSILQSWIREKLSSVSHMEIGGSYGSGKTTMLEIANLLCYHGVLSGSVSLASLFRVNEKYKPTWGLDEIDAWANKKEENLGLTLIRQAQRKGVPVIRINPKTHQEELFNIYGNYFYTLHQDLRDLANKSRALSIETSISNDNRLAIINTVKHLLLRPIYINIFFWYMDNIIKLMLDELDALPILDDIYELPLTKEDVRSVLYEKLTKSLTPEEKGFLKKFYGRNVELAYVSIRIAKSFGMDILDSLSKSFEQKIIFEAEFSETDYKRILRELLIESYKNPETYQEPDDEYYGKKKDDFIWLSNQVVFNIFNERLFINGYKKVGTHKFKSYLRDFSFLDGINYKKPERRGRILIFDNAVLNRLGISESTSIPSSTSSEYQEVIRTHTDNNSFISNWLGFLTPNNEIKNTDWYDFGFKIGDDMGIDRNQTYALMNEYDRQLEQKGVISHPQEYTVIRRS